MNGNIIVNVFALYSYAVAFFNLKLSRYTCKNKFTVVVNRCGVYFFCPVMNCVGQCDGAYDSLAAARGLFSVVNEFTRGPLVWTGRGFCTQAGLTRTN